MKHPRMLECFLTRHVRDSGTWRLSRNERFLIPFNKRDSDRLYTDQNYERKKYDTRANICERREGTTKRSTLAHTNMTFQCLAHVLINIDE